MCDTNIGTAKTTKSLKCVLFCVLCNYHRLAELLTDSLKGLYSEQLLDFKPFVIKRIFYAFIKYLLLCRRLF
jgi:hypothetical protein